MNRFRKPNLPCNIHSWIQRSLLKKSLLLWILLCCQPGFAQNPKKEAAQKQQKPTAVKMAGYLQAPRHEIPETYGAGYSMYVAAWPLMKEYPGQKFQTGLFGTWMFPLNEPKLEKFYTDIEGGLGWWRDTRFATETPKFIQGGVALNFSAWANGPGAGKGRNWSKPNGKYAIVQLSNRLMWPPDGLNLKQGTNGELFGYGYLSLPLVDAKKTTTGADVPTGENCWTLFLNTDNFKGPVSFFAPYFWSKPSVEKPELAGKFLDSRPSKANRHISMETQFVPAAVATDEQGVENARVATTYFPVDDNGDTVVLHQLMGYRKSALSDRVASWFDGGPVADGKVDVADAITQRFTGKGSSSYSIHADGVPRGKRTQLDWSSFARPTTHGDDTFGYVWDEKVVTRTEVAGRECVSFPEYYRAEKSGNNGKEKKRWVAIAASEVPAEIDFESVSFRTPGRINHEPYMTPQEPESCWKTPGPSAGPFTAVAGDGSTVTYHWYRFADQPSMLNADMNEKQREALQKRVELLHKNWKIDSDYLPPPKRGSLASLDAALLVTPPQGMEIGYVPIVTRQERK